MIKLLENRTNPDSSAMLAYGMLFTALMLVQVGMVSTAMAHPEVPTVVND